MTYKAIQSAKEMIDIAENLDELDYVEERIAKSKKIPNRRSNEGKRIRGELAQLIYEKGQHLINTNGEMPF